MNEMENNFFSSLTIFFQFSVQRTYVVLLSKTIWIEKVID